MGKDLSPRLPSTLGESHSPDSGSGAQALAVVRAVPLPMKFVLTWLSEVDASKPNASVQSSCERPGSQSPVHSAGGEPRRKSKYYWVTQGDSGGFRKFLSVMLL